MPTLKQKKAFKKTIENNGSVSRAMIEAGYSPNFAKNPQTLTESNGWKELMDEYLPDKLLAKKHLELLNKKEIITTFNHASGEREAEITEFPETQAVSKGLEMAYKMKGRFPKDGQGTQVNIVNISFDNAFIQPSEKDRPE